MRPVVTPSGNGFRFTRIVIIVEAQLMIRCHDSPGQMEIILIWIIMIFHRMKGCVGCYDDQVRSNDSRCGTGDGK